ncbi:MAG: hypothetical protein ABI361_00995 [Nitrososphaera sp.]|jgi:hypothetical protein
MCYSKFLAIQKSNARSVHRANPGSSYVDKDGVRHRADEIMYNGMSVAANWSGLRKVLKGYHNARSRRNGAKVLQFALSINAFERALNIKEIPIAQLLTTEALESIMSP